MNAWPSCCVRRAWSSTASTTATTTRGLRRARATAASRRPGCCCGAAAELDLDLGASWMIGDADTDVDRRPRRRGARRARRAPAHRAPPRAARVAARAHRSRSGAARPALHRDAKVPRRRDPQRQALRRRRGPRAHPPPRRRRADPRVHDEPDADVEGGADGLHRVLPAAARAEITDRPISFEVFADDAAEIRRQARMIAAWGENVYVKVPVTTTRGESLAARRARPQRGRRPGQRHRALHARAGRARSPPPWPTAPRATCRSSPGGSPTPAATRSRSCARRWRSCAPRRARS